MTLARVPARSMMSSTLTGMARDTTSEVFRVPAVHNVSNNRFFAKLSTGMTTQWLVSYAGQIAVVSLEPGAELHNGV